MLKGIGVSPGIAIGQALIKKHEEIRIEKIEIEIVEKELERLGECIKKCKEQINELYEYTLSYIGEEEARIFEAHSMILEDPEFLGQIEAKIESEHINSEYAIKEISDMFINIFVNMDNEYMKERANDIKDISKRLIRILLDIKMQDLSELNEEVIIIAHDLTPSDMAQMNKEKVLGFITEIGGRTTHSAIMARTLEIPAIVGVEGITGIVKNGDLLIFDGDEGKVIVNPKEKDLKAYQLKKEETKKFREKLKELRGVKSITKDGFEVELAANIGTPKDVEGVLKNDGEGVGLYRTEFLYMDRDKLPTEEEQFQAYKEVAERLEGKSVVIRTLDVGGDKDLTYLDLPNEMNPFLGYRAIRLCLDQTEIFKTQLRALLRASAFGNIKVMFPMISSIEELKSAKVILREVKEDLINNKIAFNEEIEVGMMIEIPAAAIMSDVFAKEVDFFSIGTNDLIQYTIAVDRSNCKISNLYNAFNPALLRLIKLTVENGHKEGIWVSVCGEVAGDPRFIPLLIGMGVDELSMSPISILYARWVISRMNQRNMKDAVDEVIALSSAKEVEEFVSCLE